jgi:hypothetical protein
MAAVVWALSLFQVHSDLEELQEETNKLRHDLNRVSQEDIRWMGSLLSSHHHVWMTDRPLCVPALLL